MHFNARYVVSDDLKVTNMIVCSTFLDWLLENGVPLGLNLAPLQPAQAAGMQQAQPQAPQKQGQEAMPMGQQSAAPQQQ